MGATLDIIYVRQEEKSGLRTNVSARAHPRCIRAGDRGLRRPVIPGLCVAGVRNYYTMTVQSSYKRLVSSFCRFEQNNVDIKVRARYKLFRLLVRVPVP